MKPPPDPSTHPYMLTKRGADPRYFRRLSDAKSAVMKELKSFQSIWRELNAADDLALVDKLFDQLDWVGVDGGHVGGPVDSIMGVKYDATIQVRNPL